MNHEFEKSAKIPRPGSEGLRIFYEYAGPAKSAEYLDRFGKENLLLADNLTAWAYGYVMRDETLNMKTKAAINAVALKTARDAPATLALHQQAYLRMHDNRAALALLMSLGDLLRTAENADEIFCARSDFTDKKTYYLCAIAGIAAASMPITEGNGEESLTNRRKNILKDLFSKSLFEGIRAAEIESTLFLVSAVRGFPVAIEAGRVFQEYLQHDLGYGPLSAAPGKEPQASPGLETYIAYAGTETGEAFMNGFARYNPKLARFTLDFPYQHITANDSAIPGFALKSSIKVTMLYACSDAPAAMNLHSKANKRNNEGKRILSYYEVLGTALRKADHLNDVITLKADYLESMEAFYLPVIAGLAALGEPKGVLLEQTMRHAIAEGIDKNKIRFTLNMVAVYRGFPVACEASEKFQALLQALPALKKPGYGDHTLF